MQRLRDRRLRRALRRRPQGALDHPASCEYRVLDDGMRWRIEALFFDFKAPGLLHHPKPDQKIGSIGASHPGAGNRHVLGRINRNHRRTPHRATR